MSKLWKAFAGAALIAGALALAPGPAAARVWHSGHGISMHGLHGVPHWGGGFPRFRGGAWRGRRHYYGGWGPGYGWGLGIPFFYGFPYYYGYYEPETCGWVRVPRWHHHHRVLLRVWQCW